MNPDEVKDCMRCTASLERGYSSRYVNNKCTEVICFKCDKQESIADHMKTGVITTHLMMDCMMDVYRLVDGDVHNEDKLLALLRLSDSFKSSDETKAKIKIQLATIQIQSKIKEFEARVWFSGVQDQVLATKCRGVCAKLGKKHDNFNVLTYSICGRTMITIEDKKASVTCVADETSKESRTGLHGINASGEEAIALINKAIKLYEDKTLKFLDDDKVGMF